MDGGGFQDYLTRHMADLGSVKTNTVTNEPEEKYKEKFSLANLLPVIMMLLGDKDFMKMIGGIFGGDKGGSTTADFGGISGLGDSGLGSTTPGGF